IRDQLSPTEQLVFRTGHRLPRYPITTATRPRLRLPAHRPSRPEPVIDWIPQAIWPLAIPAGLHSCAEPALLRTLLAAALAKISNPAGWTQICDQLDLPASHAI